MESFASLPIFLNPFVHPINAVVFAILIIMSVLCVTVAFLKTSQFSRLGVGRHQEAEAVLDQWFNGDVVGATEAATARPFVLCRVLKAVFRALQAKPGEDAYAEELGRQTALIELAAMERRMRLLEVIVQAAPMVGLLGTVVGMIDAFSKLAATEGVADPTLLAAGIWTALTTTAGGLAIALMAYLIANWFEGRIDQERTMMEAMISAAIHGRVDDTAPGP